MARTRILCPKGFPLGFSMLLEQPRGGTNVQRADREKLTEMLGTCPNLALLWHRYFPAHNAPDGQALVTSTWGSDFSTDYTNATALTDPREKKKALGRIKQNLSDWKGRGALQFFCDVAKHALAQAEYQEFIRREHRTWRAAIQEAGIACMFKIITVTRCKPGIGIPCSFENGGINLHPISGFPMLAGRSLKGFLTHYLDEEVFSSEGVSGDAGIDGLFSRANSLWQDITRSTGAPKVAGGNALTSLSSYIFGAGPEEDEHTPTKGAIVFYDAHPIPPCTEWFDVDVITVHQKAYYNDETNRILPTDDDTNPVHALTLAAGVHFEMALGLTAAGTALDVEIQQKLLDFTREALTSALWDWGFGARTAAGYGLMTGIHNQ